MSTMENGSVSNAANTDSVVTANGPNNEKRTCPDCYREMKGVTSRRPETAWRCEYCEATWKSVKNVRDDGPV